jgi:hypothetical protein
MGNHPERLLRGKTPPSPAATLKRTKSLAATNCPAATSKDFYEDVKLDTTESRGLPPKPTHPFCCSVPQQCASPIQEGVGTGPQAGTDIVCGQCRILLGHTVVGRSSYLSEAPSKYSSFLCTLATRHSLESPVVGAFTVGALVVGTFVVSVFIVLGNVLSCLFLSFPVGQSCKASSDP